MRNKIVKLIVLGAAMTSMAATAACDRVREEDRILYDGIYFKTKAAPVDKKKTLAQFQVVVPDAARSLDGARAAGRDAGTRYCVNTYGNSKIDWTVGPLSAPEELRFDKGDLILTGTCQRP